MKNHIMRFVSNMFDYMFLLVNTTIIKTVVNQVKEKIILIN
jgi:hypothetical protein